MYVYTGDRFSAGCTCHKRLNAVKLTLGKLPFSLLGEFQLLQDHSVGADVVNYCIRWCWRHKGKFGSNASRTRRTAKDSTQSLESVPSRTVTTATHFAEASNVYFKRHCSKHAVHRSYWKYFLLTYSQRLLNDGRCTIKIEVLITAKQ